MMRLAHRRVTNAFAMLRPLPMSDRDQDVEFLALCHQIPVLERQPGREEPRFDGSDRALVRLPRDALRRIRLPHFHSTSS
ncbi:hypothetical protein DXZ75_06075 [Streptomyces sp. AcE210]|nr:hypothetical protein DXZ75_06075 [Streptomyces sp. AcE210]